MHGLAGILHVDLQFAVVGANLDVLLAVTDFDQIGIGKFFQLFHDGVGRGKELTRVFRGTPQVFPGDKMHGQGGYGGGNPKMNVGTAGAVFVHINADDAFVECVGAGKYESAANSERGFRK
jgi:hypothetical protein